MSPENCGMKSLRKSKVSNFLALIEDFPNTCQFGGYVSPQTWTIWLGGNGLWGIPAVGRE
jgi:hypothetical protein